MYYQEKCVDGVWLYKTTPDGNWHEFTFEMYRNKLREVLASQALMAKLAKEE